MLGDTFRRFLQPPALALELQQMTSMHDAIEQRRDEGDITEQLRPVLDRSIGRDHGGELLVATHEHISEFVTGVARQLAKEQIVDDGELGATKLRTIFLNLAELARLVDLLQQRVRFTI